MKSAHYKVQRFGVHQTLKNNIQNITMLKCITFNFKAVTLQIGSFKIPTYKQEDLMHEISKHISSGWHNRNVSKYKCAKLRELCNVISVLHNKYSVSEKTFTLNVFC